MSNNRHRRDERDIGHYGRDERERSPSRNQRSRREDRYDDSSHGSRQSTGYLATRRDSQSGRGDRHNSTSAEPSRPGLSELPTRVPIPAEGREVKMKGGPMQGSAGYSVLLSVNHFEIQSLPIIKIYQYDLHLRVPESSQRRGNGKVSSMQQAKVLMHDAVKTFWGDDFVFDGVSLGWSPKELLSIGPNVSTTIDLEGHSVQRPNQVEVTIRNNGTLDVKALVDYIQGGNVELDYMSNPRIEPLMKWINALFRKDPACRFVTRPRSNAYFERTLSTMMTLQSTGGILEALRGIFQTVQIRFGRLCLSVDTATTAFFTPDKSLVQMAHALTGVSLTQDLQGWYHTNRAQFHQSCQRLEGMFINVKHLNPSRNARKMKVIRISLANAKQTEFNEKDLQTGEEKMTTVYRLVESALILVMSILLANLVLQSYFRRKYRLDLRFPDLPLALTKDGLFPFELCYSSSVCLSKLVFQSSLF